MAEADAGHRRSRFIGRANKTFERCDPVEIVIDAGRRSRDQDGIQVFGIGQRFPVDQPDLAKLAEVSAAPSNRSNICGNEPCCARGSGEMTPASMIVIFGMRLSARWCKRPAE